MRELTTYRIKFLTKLGIKSELVNNDTIQDAYNSLIALYGSIEILKIRIA